MILNSEQSDEFDRLPFYWLYNKEKSTIEAKAPLPSHNCIDWPVWWRWRWTWSDLQRWSARLTNFSGRLWIRPNQVPDTHHWVKGIHGSGVEHHRVWLTGTGNQRWVKGARGVVLVRQKGRRQTRRNGGGRPVVNGRSTERSSSSLMKPDHSCSVSQPAETRSNSIVMKRASAAAGCGLRQTHL